MDKRHKILILDDDADWLDLSREMLSTLPSQPEILTANNGKSALAILESEPVRLLICDLKMPRMDGLQVLKAMREDARTQWVPVVMMTSSREEGDLLKSYALGVNSYIVKPVDFEQFADTVAQIGMYWVLANQTPAQAR